MAKKRKLSFDINLSDNALNDHVILLPLEDESPRAAVLECEDMSIGTRDDSFAVIRSGTGLDSVFKSTSDGDSSNFGASTFAGRGGSMATTPIYDGSHVDDPIVTSALDHLHALGSAHDGASSTGSAALSFFMRKQERKPADAIAVGGTDDDYDADSSNATLGTANQRLLLDALTMSEHRDRAESWGGMSDLSHAAGGMSGAAAALAASALYHTGIFEDVTAAADSLDEDSNSEEEEEEEDNGKSHSHLHALTSISSELQPPSAIRKVDAVAKSKSASAKKLLAPTGPARYCRDPLDSLASLSEASLTISVEAPPGKKRTEYDGETLQAAVSATVVALDGQREDAANSGTMKLAANNSKRTVKDSLSTKRSRTKLSTSTAVGEVTDTVSSSNTFTALGEQNFSTKLRSDGLATCTAPPAPRITVDSDAVHAAVAAAMAATANGMEFAAMIGTEKSISAAFAASSSSYLLKAPPVAPPLSAPSTTMSETDFVAMRERARAAAGYVPPDDSALNHGTSNKESLLVNSYPVPLSASRAPFKKRTNFDSVLFLETVPSAVSSSSPYIPDNSLGALDISSSHHAIPNEELPVAHSCTSVTSMSTNVSLSAKSLATPSSITPQKGGQSNQKWEDMFDCLLQFIKDQKVLATTDLVEKDEPEWDGNVPTTYKSKDGKALGRWINNQRSAKSKGTLKRDREVRLVSTGLKWCVLATNAWPDMMEELRTYVNDKTKDGKPWDGNVPTNYRTKGNTASDGSDIDEDKNLGRWINRQRSLFQAGKLRKDRQLELEKIGLKWSVLSTTSWQSMFDALCEYAKSKTQSSPPKSWDGNVPANYKTDDSPPKSLGRWVNRQRSAYAKDKLKESFVTKLEKVGLKWAMHEKKGWAETGDDILADQNVVDDDIEDLELHI